MDMKTVRKTYSVRKRSLENKTIKKVRWQVRKVEKKLKGQTR